MTYSILVSDLDGTLTKSKAVLEPETASLLQKILTTTPIAVMSGGSFAQYHSQFLPHLLPHTNLEHLLLFPTSAAECYFYEDGMWHTKYSHTFSEEERTRVLGKLSEGVKIYMQEERVLFGERIEDRGAQITFSGLGQRAPLEEKRGWDPDFKKRTPLFAFLQSQLPDFQIAMNAMSSIDITKKGINKAYGIRFLQNSLHIPVERMLYIGDALYAHGNDAVVKETGITTIQVTSLEQTHAVLQSLIVI